MKRRIIKIFRSFKSRILFSFLAFNAILLLWICIYFFINKKQSQLNLFSYHLTQVQNKYSVSNSNLDYFILSGFHQPSFYATGNQKNIDLFLAEQSEIKENLDQIKDEAQGNHININGEIHDLIRLHNSLADSAALLKTFYFNKGYKDWGTEGAMRDYAHYLENYCHLGKVDLLMLRRHEKDFIMRQEQRYIDEFNAVMDTQLIKFATSPATLNALQQYRKNFNTLVFYTRRLSVNENDGLYGHVQTIVTQLREHYLSIETKVQKQTADLDRMFRTMIIIISAVLLSAALVLTVLITNFLTRDIGNLSKILTLYVRSRFRDDDNQLDQLTSKITEVERLNKNFIYLKHTLSITLSDLQLAVKEEKKASANLESTISQLNLHMQEVELQKQEIENSEAKLNAFFNSSASCHIMVGTDLNIIAFNKAAVSFIKELNGKELVKGAYILLFLNETYIDTFIDGYKDAMSGKFIGEERLINTGSSSSWWDISFVPALDKEGNIFAISFNATNINEAKTHTNKIKSQNEILLKIAHVQSHEVRGPIATIMGIMNLIKEEENFNMEYLSLLEEAVYNFDQKIHAIVDYTKQVS